MNPDPARELIRAYHQRTKHHLDRYAAGPGSLDWDAQPDPFRVWSGTEKVPLPRTAEHIPIPWDDLEKDREPAPLNLESLGNLLQLSAAITAWKEYAGSRWALRANPSSGNLHPTESWVVARGVAGLADGLYHYQPRDHSLELRAAGGEAGSPGLWLGFSSIHWREAWKYGERAFRYCQLDLGHLLATVATAAALLGWKPRLVPLAWGDLSHRLGLDRVEDFAGVEAEEAETLLALHSADVGLPPPDWAEWHGRPGLLDPKPMYQWPVIEEVAQATRGNLFPSPHGGRRWESVEHRSTPPEPDGCAKPSVDGARGEGTRPALNHPVSLSRPSGPASPEGGGVAATHIILKRRSAQAFDGRSVMPLAAFRRLLERLPPGGAPAWDLWPLPPRVHPVLMVHRVEGIVPGLYVFPRSTEGEAALRGALRSDMAWEPVAEAPGLFRLVGARCGNAARTLSCHQDIAANCGVAFMFLAEFAGPIAGNPAAYRHLHWEAGMLGQQLYLEAEAQGWRGTGIGCFFDDAVHDILGLTDEGFQVLYHFSAGVPVDDPRLLTRPAYE